jgi:hypothetical protein
VVNGPHSGMALVVFVVVLAVRLVSAQRRRSTGRAGGPGGARGFTGPAGPGHRTPRAGDGQPSGATDPGAAGDSGTTFGGTSPGWFRDPFVRHEQRFWSGEAWTEHVQDRGVPGIDPPPPPRDPVG